MPSTLNCISVLHCPVTFGLLQETQRSEGEAAREDVDLWQLKKKQNKQKTQNNPPPQKTSKTKLEKNPNKKPTKKIPMILLENQPLYDVLSSAL